jgi:hypothetical protein
MPKTYRGKLPDPDNDTYILRRAQEAEPPSRFAPRHLCESRFRCTLLTKMNRKPGKLLRSPQPNSAREIHPPRPGERYSEPVNGQFPTPDVPQHRGSQLSLRANSFSSMRHRHQDFQEGPQSRAPNVEVVLSGSCKLWFDKNRSVGFPRLTSLRVPDSKHSMVRTTSQMRA